jgi:hypothetical protein
MLEYGSYFKYGFVRQVPDEGSGRSVHFVRK